MLKILKYFMEEPTQGQVQPGNTQSAHQTNSTGPHTEPHKPLPPKLPAYSALPQLEEWLEEYLGQKAPQMPEKWRQIIAKISPWIILVVAILGLPLIFAAFGLGIATIPAAAMVGYHFGTWTIVLAIVSIASLVLEIIALPGLFHRAKKGWVFVFYAALITAAVNILSINIGGILGDIIGLYLLFQIKNQYK